MTDCELEAQAYMGHSQSSTCSKSWRVNGLRDPRTTDTLLI